MTDPRRHVMGFTDDEIKEYDQHVEFYYSNLIESVILYTYDKKGLDDLHPILGDPLVELWEELDYAYLPVLIETVFVNNRIDPAHRSVVLSFKEKVEQISDEIWEWEELDTNPIWLAIKFEANQLLDILGVKSRTYEANRTTLYSNNRTITHEGSHSKNIKCR